VAGAIFGSAVTEALVIAPVSFLVGLFVGLASCGRYVLVRRRDFEIVPRDGGREHSGERGQ
jgi:hypothetical protein